MTDFKDHVLIFLFIFLCFRFHSLHSWLRQSLFLRILMRTTQISKAVLSNTMLILCRHQSVFHCHRMNDGLRKSQEVCHAWLLSQRELCNERGLLSRPLMYFVTIYGTRFRAVLSSRLTDPEKVMHIGKDTSTRWSNLTVATIVMNVVTRHHIQKLMQVYLWWTTFHTQTMMIDTFCESADQTADERPLTWDVPRRKVV